MAGVFVGPSPRRAAVQTFKKTVTQSNSFAFGEHVRFDGVNYVDAQANTSANAEWVGQVTDASPTAFTYCYGGITTGHTGLTPGGVYFLSDSVPGAMTLVEPSAPGISCPIGQALSDTEMLVFTRMRGVVPGPLTPNLGVDSLDVTGSAGFGLANVSANTTLDGTHFTVIVDASSGAKTITLPAAATSTRRTYQVVKGDSTQNLVTITRTGADTISGATSVKLGGQWDSIEVQADAANNRWVLFDRPVPPFYGLLGKIIGANFNSTADQVISIPFSSWHPTRVTVTNASANLTTAAGGLYTGASKTGTAVVAAAQVYSALTASGKHLDATVAAVDRQSANPIYLSLTTAQGAPATGDVYVWGLVYAW